MDDFGLRHIYVYIRANETMTLSKVPVAMPVI